MTPRARWQQIQVLFEQVADCDPARSAQLAEHCADDAELRDSVESCSDRISAARTPCCMPSARRPNRCWRTIATV